MLVEVVAGNLRYAVAQHQVLLHGRTAQVKVAVLQTDLVTDLLGVVDLKRGGLRLGQNADVLGNNFDLAGRHLLVDGRRVTSTSLPLTATTNSVRQVNAMSNRSAFTDLSKVHCTMPARSRSSRNSTPPLSRTRSTQPFTVTV